jgi:hypothetical protein
MAAAGVVYCQDPQLHGLLLNSQASADMRRPARRPPRPHAQLWQAAEDGNCARVTELVAARADVNAEGWVREERVALCTGIGNVNLLPCRMATPRCSLLREAAAATR